MEILKKLAGGLLAFGLLTSVPVQAADMGQNNDGQAEKLRRLDIMLMVTGLRCRMTTSDFMADFADFEAVHMTELNAAAADLRGGLVAAYGAEGAERALDRLSTIMANQYGGGHPRLACADLKSITRQLAAIPGRAVLIEAADQLLVDRGGAQLAWTQR